MAVVLRTKLKRRPKYGNKKVIADGITFGSEKEWLRYLELMLAERNGLIVRLEVHPKFDIVVNGKMICRYIADFAYLVPVLDMKNVFEKVVEDTKGIDERTGWDTRTDVYILKKKLMKVVLQIDVKEI